MLRATTLQTPQENHLAVDLAHGDIVVLYALEVLLHLVQFVVVSGKECACLRLRLLVQMFDNGPRNTDAVVGRGAAPQLVE